MKTVTRMFLAASTMLFLYSCDPEDISAETSDVLIDDARSETGDQEGDIAE